MIDPHPCQHQEMADNLSATFHHLYIWESLQVWYCSLSETTPVGFHGSSPLLSKRHSSYKTADTSCECHPWTWTVDTHDFSSIEFENINRWNSIFNLTSTYEATLSCRSIYISMSIIYISIPRWLEKYNTAMCYSWVPLTEIQSKYSIKSHRIEVASIPSKAICDPVLSSFPPGTQSHPCLLFPYFVEMTL